MKDETGWLIELPGPKYWYGAGYTYDHNEALRFAREEDAVKVIRRSACTGAKAVEHLWVNGPPPAEKAVIPSQKQFSAKQDACDATGMRYYGDGGTIHSSWHLDVETRSGDVVAVWFRCQTLPFKQHEVDRSRALSMREAYAEHKIELHGVEVRP